MLTTIALIAGQILVGAALIQSSIAISFGRWFAKKSPRPMPADQQKQVAVIMSVRGCDPSLRHSLTGILNQEYQDYEVHLVVDHRTDRAWDFVHQIKSELDQRNLLTIHELRDPLDSCSLKCHALVQAIAQLPEETHFIALLDADATPHKTWMSELVGPLSDPDVGGVTGNQWFEPKSPASIGSLTRSSWNAGALVPTIYFSNPWAGSFAMRLKDLKESGLKETWSRSIVDDGPLKRAITALGLRIEFAPSLILVNREPCTFAYARQWVTRMLTWSRLYEKTFLLPMIHAAFSNCVMIANFAVLLTAIAMGNLLAMGISTAALIASGLLCAQAYFCSRRCVARSCQLRGETLPPMKYSRFVGILLAVPSGHLIYGISCVKALLSKRIRWRQISYEIKSHDDVKRLNYQPYVARDPQSDVSI